MIYSPPTKAYLEDGTTVLLANVDFSFSVNDIPEITMFGHLIENDKARVVTNKKALIIEDDLMIDLIQGIIDDNNEAKQ